LSGKRAAAAPPALPGFTFLEPLGSGGFADVFLYEQHLPRRRVAVKVLLPERMVGAAAEQFSAEANVMALLSTHPAIVTIYQAGVSDDGRSYLVMEYCPKPNLQVRARSSAISVAEALRVGIQVAAAVETAHRAGILHRDIKPANILVTEYNRPALTDFGIATTADAADPSTGMSIPWSPPESFADVPQFGVQSDVYALGATVYTLLAGRSPFEVPGGSNGAAHLMRRIESDPLAPIARADVPGSLQAVLDRAMAKRPVDRYETAVAFARALQKVQIELAHSVTPIDILDDAPPVEEEEDDGELTRVRGIVSIDPQTSPAAGPTADRSLLTAAPRTTTAPVDETVRRSFPSAPGVPDDSDDLTLTGIRPPAAPVEAAWEQSAPVPTATRPPSRKGLWIGLGAGAAAAAVIVGVVVTASVLAPPAAPEASPTSAPVAPQDPAAGYIPPPQEGAAVVEGDQAVFTWMNGSPEDGDAYVWRTVTLDGVGDPVVTEETTATVPHTDSRTCIEVGLVRAGGSSSELTRICTP